VVIYEVVIGDVVQEVEAGSMAEAVKCVVCVCELWDARAAKARMVGSKKWVPVLLGSERVCHVKWCIDASGNDSPQLHSEWAAITGESTDVVQVFSDPKLSVVLEESPQQLAKELYASYSELLHGAVSGLGAILRKHSKPKVPREERECDKHHVPTIESFGQSSNILKPAFPKVIADPLYHKPYSPPKKELKYGGKHYRPANEGDVGKKVWCDDHGNLDRAMSKACYVLREVQQGQSCPYVVGSGEDSLAWRHAWVLVDGPAQTVASNQQPEIGACRSYCQPEALQSVAASLGMPAATVRAVDTPPNSISKSPEFWEHEGVRYRLADERDVGKKVYFVSDVSFDHAIRDLIDPGILQSVSCPGMNPYVVNCCWKYVWVPLEEPEPQPTLPEYNPGPHPPIPEGWYTIEPDEVIVDGDKFGSTAWLLCSSSIGSTPRVFDRAKCQATVIRKKPTRWRACKTLSEFEPFWGAMAKTKHAGGVTPVNVVYFTGCFFTLDDWFNRFTTLDGKPIGVEEVEDPS